MCVCVCVCVNEHMHFYVPVSTNTDVFASFQMVVTAPFANIGQGHTKLRLKKA